MSTQFIFVRHGESKKNLKKIFGGEGDVLTDLGKQQVEQFIVDLKNRNLTKPVHVFATPRLQTIQSADIIAKAFNTKTICDERLRSQDLGALGGKTAEEQQRDCPKEFECFSKWRNREIEACDLNIADLEPFSKLVDRVIDFLKSNDNNEVNIIVCTRSIMVFAKNYVQGNSLERGGGFLEQYTKNCESVDFLYDKEYRRTMNA